MTASSAPCTSPSSPESASPANSTTAEPSATIAMSTRPARTRRLSSWGPVADAEDACAIAFITPSIGNGERKLSLQASSPPVERVAVIDMGSNSWRLVVFGYEPGTPWWSLVDEIREAVRIGAGLGEKGVLSPDRVDRALHTAAVFAAFCEATGVDDVVAVATSAIRDARNGGELLSDIRRTTGLEARVISGHEEARYGWLAIANSTTIDDGFGLDIGGGSIQGLRIEGRRLADSESLPLGAVRVSEHALPDEKVSSKQMKALRAHVAAEFERLGWWRGGGHIVGIGGTIRNLAAAAMKRLTLPDIDVQGFELTREALGELIDELAGHPASKRAQVKGI